MNIITLDFETYFDSDYTLKKLTTEEYVRDPRFEVLGVGLKLGGNSWWSSNADDIGTALRLIDLEKAAVLCHHAQFDGLILSHHYGIRPAAWLDTLSMARMVLGNHVSASLDSLSRHFHLPAKSVPYEAFRGKHWADLDNQTQRLVADGCLHDVDLTWRIFNLFAKDFPCEEYRIIDQTIRMFTEPVLEGDIELLGKVWTDEQTRKQLLLEQLGVDRRDLQSSGTFAKLLRAEGIEPGTKASPRSPDKTIYAFAKTDEFMKELLDDDNPRISSLAQARLGIKSTIDQTRAERLGFMARRGAMAVYLQYCGAHTTRWSGGDSLNWQNFRRGGELRRSIRAPAGHKLVILDESQIECRILNVLAGQWDVIDKFRNGEDPYIGIASAAYGFEVTRANEAERGTGKQLELSCGFGAGAETIQRTAARGTYGPPLKIDMATATRWRDLYRSTHPCVVKLWGDAGRMIARLGGGPPAEWGPMVVRDMRIYLPNGAWLNYDTLEYHHNEGDDDPWEDGWRYRLRNGWTKLYGGKLVENVVQALARVVLSQAMLRISALGYRIVLCTHDDIVVCVESGKADEAFAACKAEMERTPAWLPELPVSAEGGISERYDK
jgi:DNA polymerase bacteriophage-type